MYDFQTSWDQMHESRVLYSTHAYQIGKAQLSTSLKTSRKSYTPSIPFKWNPSNRGLQPILSSSTHAIRKLTSPVMLVLMVCNWINLYRQCALCVIHDPFDFRTTRQLYSLTNIPSLHFCISNASMDLLIISSFHINFM